MSTSSERTIDSYAPELAWYPTTEPEVAAVRHQLERLLSTSLFCHSRRYPSLLRYAVECAIGGRTENLKERTIGVEVFGRDPSYDTGSDPIVRTTAVEIRKRLAQYYQAPEHHAELRIEFPTGSYIPVLHPAPLVEPTVEEFPESATFIPVPEPKLHRRFLAVLAVLFAVGGTAAAYLILRPTPLDQFWAPVIESTGSAMLCIGEAHRPVPPPNGEQAPAPPVSARQLEQTEYIALSDSSSLTRVATVLAARHKDFTIRAEALTDFNTLREGPAVLIGGFNNTWTLRFTGPLRYTFERKSNDGQGQDHRWVGDRQNPSDKRWSVDGDLPYSDLTDDYAIITRLFDPNTQKTVVIIGGLLKWATRAAGEFVTDPKYMAQLARTAPRDWDKQNMQIVIATRVFAASSGAPRVVAKHYWNH